MVTRLLQYKNYVTMINALPGSNLFRHLYMVDDNNGTGRESEFDATDDGDLSCAEVVSSVLRLFGWIDSPHATVQSTLLAIKKCGWYETCEKNIEPGDIVVWPASETKNEHIGFYIGKGSVISNISKARVPGKHALIMSDGRSPVSFWSRDFDDKI